MLRQASRLLCREIAFSCPRRVHCPPCGGALCPARSGCTGVAPAVVSADLQIHMQALPAHSRRLVTVLDLRLQARAYKQPCSPCARSQLHMPSMLVINCMKDEDMQLDNTSLDGRVTSSAPKLPPTQAAHPHADTSSHTASMRHARSRTTCLHAAAYGQTQWPSEQHRRAEHGCPPLMTLPAGHCSMSGNLLPALAAHRDAASGTLTFLAPAACSKFPDMLVQHTRDCIAQVSASLPGRTRSQQGFTHLSCADGWVPMNAGDPGVKSAADGDWGSTTMASAACDTGRRSIDSSP